MQQQSLMIANRPYMKYKQTLDPFLLCTIQTYNDTVFSYSHIRSNSGSFNDASFSNSNMITNLHRIVAENAIKQDVSAWHFPYCTHSRWHHVPFVSLVRWSYNGSLGKEAVTSNSNYNSVSTPCPPKITTNNAFGLYNSLLKDTAWMDAQWLKYILTLPPRIMFWLPQMTDARETLLPVS